MGPGVTMHSASLSALAAIAALALAAAPADALWSTVENLDTTLLGRTFNHSYEEFNCGISMLAQDAYPGFIYSEGNLVFGECVQHHQWPACDGTHVAVNTRSGIVEVESDALHPFNHVTGCCATVDPFVGPNAIAIEITDVSGNITRTSCRSNSWGSYQRFSLTSALPAFLLTMREPGGYWSWDDLRFSLRAT